MFRTSNYVMLLVDRWFIVQWPDAQGGWAATSHLHIVRRRQLRLYGHIVRLSTEDSPMGYMIVTFRVWTIPSGRPYASWSRQVEAWSQWYGHGETGVCLGDGQTEAEGVLSQGGRGDALLQRMPPPIPDLNLTFWKSWIRLVRYHRQYIKRFILMCVDLRINFIKFNFHPHVCWFANKFY